jgi:hypothetical protein
MDDKEIYEKLLKIEANKNKQSIYFDLFIFFACITFIGWSIVKDISQETEQQKLNRTIFQQNLIIERVHKDNIKLRDTLKKLLDAIDPKKTKSEA